MSKRLAIAVVACACVAVAYGAAVKITSFAAFGPDSSGDGMAILRHVQGQDNTVAQIILSGLSPNTEYVVALREPNTWHLVTTGFVVEAQFVSVTKPIGAGIGFFAISIENSETDNRGHLTIHASTVPDSGDVSDYDVFVFLQSDWVGPAPGATAFNMPVRLIGYNGTTAP